MFDPDSPDLLPESTRSHVTDAMIEPRPDDWYAEATSTTASWLIFPLRST